MSTFICALQRISPHVLHEGTHSNGTLAELIHNGLELSSKAVQDQVKYIQGSTLLRLTRLTLITTSGVLLSPHPVVSLLRQTELSHNSDTRESSPAPQLTTLKTHPE